VRRSKVSERLRTTGNAGHFGVAAGPLAGAAGLLALAPSTLFWFAGFSLAAAFVFALFEHALTYYTAVRLLERARAKGAEARIQEALDRQEESVFASKMGRGIAQLLGVGALVVGLFEAGPSRAVALAAAGFALVLFPLVNIALPYVLALRNADGILLHGLLAYDRAIAPLRPLARLLHRIAGRLVDTGEPVDPSEELRDEILSAVEEGGREGLLEAAEAQMIEGVIDLSEVAASNVMTPRTEMVAVPLSARVEGAAKVAIQHGLSRIPVYRTSPDDILGVLYMRDLLPFYVNGEPMPPLEQLVRQPFFVPESKNVKELLHDMKARQVHLAIVLDEYGGTAGVITLEDILEEIVGEIGDEHEKRKPGEVVRVGADSATVGGGVHVEELNRALGIKVPESGEYETVGGLLLARLGRVPSKGEQLDLDGVRFTILDADERRVNRVKVTVRSGGSAA